MPKGSLSPFRGPGGSPREIPLQSPHPHTSGPAPRKETPMPTLKADVYYDFR